jgi:hypothetical protein
MNDLAVRDSGIIDQVLIKGDLERLTPEEKADYYNAVCTSLGLNPLTRPFEFIKLNGKLRLYALKDATDQLRRVYQISLSRVEKETIDGMMVVTAYARMPNGREDTDVGVVTVKGLQGDNLANAMMKAITKAKRRVTLSICGLGWLDETEIETIPPHVVQVVEPAEETPPAAVNGQQIRDAFFAEAIRLGFKNEDEVKAALADFNYKGVPRDEEERKLLLSNLADAREPA